ncbi:hypothetical protein BLA50215_07952 [Burkholderia lata]|uniref:DUF262 domain-containing protein n=1 Tax=Burkholderia lata (strain ATCC 17760 / DSM 23089 / LMG 22485 / NCIMB 9086 / R18194 / 383) TaxID=482957 RepID=UPI00145388C2|nr:DUF262 domain-containing protein [Burkholderia lata]VWD65118.1 hypothetical protein BLA50215_07952 [Burkholderia lata]
MTDPINTLEIKSHGLGACLASNFLTVPRYQRAYSWEDDNVGDFMTDVNTSFNNGAAEYFMGSVVIQGADQKYEVVDGQQRLTTATILVAAVRDYLDEKGQAAIAEDLERQFLLTKDTWQQQIKPRMVLSDYDNAFFVSSILETKGGNVTKPTRESHERILRAKAAARAFIIGFVAQTANWLERLQRLIEFLEHKVRVIMVMVPSQANAYVIFETLNDRGRDLSASDLLKNYLFGKAGNRLDEVQTKWNLMLGALEIHGGDAVVITYIRQLWSATREVAREKELFSKIKDKIINVQTAVDFASELHERARNYAAIINENDGSWDELGAEAKSIIRSLNLLKLERHRPALLALICCFEKSECIKAMRLLLNGAVRYLIVTGAGGGTLESAYSDAARKIFTGEIKTATAFGKELQKIIPNDEAFKASFKTARSSKAFLARYYMTTLERAANGEENCELVPNENVTAVNLEHVLPENPQENWPHVEPDVAAAYSKRLGNLAILSTALNTEIGNKGFEEKRKVLAASQFKLTNGIADYASWGPVEIDARQAMLADLAVKAWGYTP